MQVQFWAFRIRNCKHTIKNIAHAPPGNKIMQAPFFQYLMHLNRKQTRKTLRTHPPVAELYRPPKTTSQAAAHPPQPVLCEPQKRVEL